MNAPPMLKRYAVLWDADRQPHCPVCRVQMYLFERHNGTPGTAEQIAVNASDVLKCPKCDAAVPLSNEYGTCSLGEARDSIQSEIRQLVALSGSKVLPDGGRDHGGDTRSFADHPRLIGHPFSVYLRPWTRRG